MIQADHEIKIKTRGPGLYEITGEIAAWLSNRKVMNGLLTVYCPHTSASLVIQENADPDVQRDLASFFARIAPKDSALYRHATEGPDDMPAHIRAALTQTSISIPISGGRMRLGTWQGIYLFEHRDGPMPRTVQLHVIGE
ncbi:MAG: secondary thiamine-phosphate synthase enzyme YjbQ [Alphaproteobacteria bacterium]